jgi:hypothetical protein
VFFDGWGHRFSRGSGGRFFARRVGPGYQLLRVFAVGFFAQKKAAVGAKKSRHAHVLGSRPIVTKVRQKDKPSVPKRYQKRCCYAGRFE